VNGLVLYVSGYGDALTALGAEDGGVRFSIPVLRDDVDSVFVAPGGNKGEITVCLRGRVIAVDAGSGAVLRSMECKRDRRIAPIARGDGYILVKQYRGDTVSRVSRAGEDAWTCRLPGYVMTHPSTFGPWLLLQTRQGSYGGQASLGIDANTGEQLWSDTVNAYGAGIAFADDAKYCVESDSYLAPDTTEAWLIARDPGTGARRWHYRKPGTTVEHAPLIDTTNDRVYAALGSGTIVCLDGASGAPVWETVLPQSPARAPAADYEPYASCMSLSAGVLTVVAADQMLYFIRAADGRVGQRIALTEDTIRHGKRAGSPRLIAGPWIAGQLLIVSTERGITAHSLAGMKGMDEGNAVGPAP
jgi:outer membrane protein assembly factor BamB